MSSLVERLRVRSERRPVYSLDLSDDEADLGRGKSGDPSEKPERIVREDTKEDSCQSCGESGALIDCETCTYAYHPKCLVSPLKAPFPASWKCPECVSPLIDIEKILDHEVCPTAVEDGDSSTPGSNQIFVKQYLVKWRGYSYLHCSWVPEKEFIKAFKTLPRLRTKVNNFHRQMSSSNNSEDDYAAIRSEWTTVDRILACRGDADEKEYFVKWKELQYDECSWESESDISAFQPEIERFQNIQSRRRRHSNKLKCNFDSTESHKKQKEFQQYEQSPEFLSGGSLHPYQLEGLNFLRFSWSKQTHVILADEMGLGKTIQSIAFLASLFEEGVYPHLVVAPLSTLRNWEREFALWAPHLNVIMYVGSAQARGVIREYEFYYPKKSLSKKLKKKKSGQLSSGSKQDRIKFDVLLTSYEMINLDSASLKPITWESMIVDEGHRLKNKDSKLFLQLKQYHSKHRVLLTGTPLQNNLDELFMLMHFLDAGKFGSLDEFQEEFKDINQEEQISRLHKMLAPHLLRRVKKDVLKEMPPKKELILRVELSSKQKEYYKAILTRNYELLTRKGGGQISLINVVMELRKLCCHPYMLEGVEPVIPDSNESFKQLLESSGKLQLLDKMIVKLKDQGHRVLIYSQFQNMLDILEDYLLYKKWQYERIDGKVSGSERQIRIDRFNAKNSNRFCFLLSTRAGGLGINLATADTVIIYDSDWNPHADLQAMARAHRLGQTNKVMIYRLITRGSIEERMMQMTKKKMVLEHLVVGKLKTQNINQEELDDIIRYGSKELFVDETEEAKARQIHYDDAAIDRLLDRERAGDEETTLDEVDDNEFLKAFKVANFKYIDEAEAAAKEEAQKAAESKSAMNSSDRTTYWEDLLKDRYEVNKVEEFNSLGKGKRSRKQMVSVEDDDLAGLQDVSSDGEDDNYEAELTDGETTLSGAPSGKRPYRKRARVDGMVAFPLMEGEGKSFRVLGFNQSQRALFVQVLMRFGVGEFDWSEFVPRLKQKTYEEIKEYGLLFLSHLAEEISDSPNFSDGVPKDGLRVQDVLVRIAVLLLIREKVKSATERSDESLFEDDVLLRYPTLRGGRVWKREHDLILLRAVLKHGYGRWQAILDDKELQIQDIICQELNLQVISLANLPIGSNQAQNGSQVVNEPSGDLTKGTVSQNGSAPEPASGGTDAFALLYQFREMQRRQVEFIKKRVLLLEKGLNSEFQNEYLGDEKSHGAGDEGPENANKAAGMTTNADLVAKLVNKPLHVEVLATEEITSATCGTDPRRQRLAEHYNQLEENHGKVNQIFTEPQNHPTHHGPESKDRQQYDEALRSNSFTHSRAENMEVQAQQASVQDVKMADAVDANSGQRYPSTH
ncbi:CHD3-type chromatin-remodeling factor PICKLE-like isoform X2 [Amaranthus tricolor]|uniref:CHD3-type chromatin-remodeling factor PICKLE-like isoform X2 n=1 Tax=Amaranthus tricolor TaxID=29722 RepID=UPI00258CBB86|nr:CHD3-type chromatin-remodeling factor PICKLE-like isoform X2 [Amaranthus tricolor]